MALTPNFSTSQTPGQPSIVTLQDTSTGSDVNITQRRIYFKKDDGTFKVPSGTSTEYVAWAYALSTISVDMLDKDYAFAIIVQWLDAGNVVLYDKTIPTGLTLYNETNDYGRTQKLSGNPLLINDDDFWERKEIMRTQIDSGNQAITFAGDLFAAQQCYNAATNIRLNYP